MMTKKQSIP